MAFITADRVKDTSTTTGTGNITVSGSAPFGYRTFSTVLSVADTFYYAIQGQSTAEWEIGVGTYVSTNQFARTTVLASSASGSAVSFSSGTKNVFITLAATRTLQLKSGDTPTAGSIPYGDGSTLSYSSVGTAGQVLISGGSSSPTWSSAGTGSVTSVAVSGGTTGLTTSGGPVTTSGTITLAGTLATANGGTGGTATPTAGTIPYGTGTALAYSAAGTSGQVLTSGGAGAPTWSTITGTGTVTSVNVSGGSTGLTYSGGPITGSGTITMAGTLAVANGGTGLTTTPSNGQLDIGNGSGFTRATLTAGSNITITNGVGSISIASTGGGAASNRIINGNMAVDQRNAGAAQTITAAAALAYTVDRWYAYCTGANVTGQQVAGATANQYRYRFTGGASVTAIGFAQRIEAINSADLASTTATLSVDLANSLLTTVTWTAYYANTTDTFGSLASPTVTSIATGTFTVTSTVTRYNAQITIPSAATTGLQILFTVGAQTSGTWTIGSVQLESGSSASAYVSQIYSSQLAQCQRYYAKSYDTGTVPGTASTTGSLANISTSGGLSIIAAQIKTTLRATPTVTLYNPSTGAIGTWYDGGALSPTAAVFLYGVNNIAVYTVSGSASSSVYGHYVANSEL
jgi:hypothetical protein